MAHTTYFSEIYHKPILDDKGKHLEKLSDLIFKDGEELAEITHMVLIVNGKKLKFKWDYVATIGPKIYLNAVKEKVHVSEVTDSDLLVNEILMDRQLVDINGLKVVRVNDVLLTKNKQKFFISAVGVGLRSLLRRLGLEKPVLLAIPNLKANLVPWQYVQSLSTASSHLELKFSRQKINDVHPADIADLMDELSHSERQILFNSLDEQTAAETLAEAQPEIQRSLVEHLHEAKMNSILRKLSPSEIVDLFGSASTASRVKLFALMEQMDKQVFKKIARLLPFPDEWAGGLMKTEYFAIPVNFTVQQTRNYLKKQKDIEDFHHLYVVDEERKLVGQLLLKDLFLQKSKSKIRDIMDSQVIYVHLKDPLKKVANTFSKYHLYALPVVDKNERLAGIITMNDVFEEVSPKHWRKQSYFAKRTHPEK
ncbi:MAG: CBS domain-containing protein [Candidatus Diapherotrites archaeon]|uniref:CBS domain-containing protein n=1 Tax=Candidatus Iainarchaeum sp. TaxID=3101447 RepID=A0A8T4L3R7_9ARCH|nr:CBS domain-containing protein [Candidatus Diapherotrites archaeon]